MTLAVKLDGSMFDYGTVQSAGFFDGRTNTITWPTSAVAGLANVRPGQAVTVPFSVVLKQNFGSGGLGAKDSYIKASVRLETPDVPSDIKLDRLVATTDLITRISAAPTLEQRLATNDSTFGSTGPFPPKVDQTTLLTIQWIALNPSNDLTPAKVSAVLAPGVTWLNKTRVSGSQPQPMYNAKANTVTWDLGTLPGGTGSIWPTANAFFQVSITPSVNQIDKDAVLLIGPKLEGTDVITKEQIVRALRDLTTNSVQNGGLTRVQR